MPTEHVNIPDGERHEPKGADSATSGQVYVSDGANSGSWSKPSAANTTIADAGGYLTATEVEAAIQEIMAKKIGDIGEGLIPIIMKETVLLLSTKKALRMDHY